MKTDLFQSCGHCWVFQICWHVECNTLTSSFRIWNSSTGIPSPPLALFVVTLPKAHLTSHSRMSGSRWVIIPLWLPGSWRYFWKSSSVYSCHLILMFCFCSIHTFSVLYCAHLCMKCFLGISDFPQEISSLSHSIIFLYFFALITEEGFLISPLFSGTLHSDGCTFPFLLWLSLLFSAICKASSGNHFAFLHFFFLGMVLITTSCIMSRTSIHSSSGTLSDLIPWIRLSFPL